MGMSGDYKEAIKAGSNMIRIGSNIFGKDNFIKIPYLKVLLNIIL